MTETPPDGSTPSGIQVVRITAPPPIDKVSILAVATLTALPPVALVLGLVGLVRTRRGRRSGRWAAVAATAIGAVASVAIVAVVIGVIWWDARSLGISEARRGDCVNLDGDSDGTQMWARDCWDEHDAEVVFRGDFTSSLLADYQRFSTSRFCLRAMRDLPLPDVYEPRYTLGTIVDSFSVSRPDLGDAFVCVLERADREPLTKPLGYSGDA